MPEKEKTPIDGIGILPLAVSKHVKGRLYFAANKVFKSDDYGNSWEVISDDLTQQINRNTLDVYDRVLSIDAVAKNGSTSPYGTIVALSESPLDKDLLAIGTDDGLGSDFRRWRQELAQGIQCCGSTKSFIYQQHLSIKA